MRLVISLYLVLFSLTGNSVEILRISKDKKLYIEIEAHSSEVSVHCTPIDSEHKNNFTYIFVRSSQKTYEFINRRPWDDASCQWRKKETQKVIDSDNWISLTGERGSEEVIKQTEPDDLGNPPPNAKSLILSTWIFHRIKSATKCFSYFTQDCSQDPIESTFGKQEQL